MTIIARAAPTFRVARPIARLSRAVTTDLGRGFCRFRPLLGCFVGFRCVLRRRGPIWAQFAGSPRSLAAIVALERPSADPGRASPYLLSFPKWVLNPEPQIQSWRTSHWLALSYEQCRRRGRSLSIARKSRRRE